MKKSLALVALLVAGFTSAQKSATFETKIQPEKKYILETVTLNNMDMDVPGQEKMSIMQEIKGPLTMKTSKAAANGNVPAELTYGEVSIRQTVNGTSQDQKNPISGMVVSGNFDNTGKFSIESTKGGDLTDEIRGMVTKMLDGNFKQINFPKKAINIGESFEDTTPLSIPMGQLGAMEATIKTTYTLVRIEDGIGYFDTKQAMTMTGNPSGVEMTATGAGTGKLEMSLTDKYLKKLASVMDMDMNFTVQGMAVTMKSKATTSSTAVVSKI